LIRVAPEGWPFIGLAWLLVAVLAGLGWWIPLVLWVPVALWVVAFFRNPERNGPRGDELVISPADGRIVAVIPIDEPVYVRGAATRISIFMSVWDVHVNRYPASGTVGYRFYSRGRFGHAMREKASADNEQCSLGLEASRGRILIRQIAGSVARRIVTDHEPGTVVRQGDRMGLIRFGSRVDVFVPAGTDVLVTPGETARAGLTVLAKWS
jgi:phosphatidylserine decarboxylase